MSYPIKKFDTLNRLIYMDYNGVERVVNIYWKDTKNIKIKYRFYGEDVEINAYDINGREIIEYTPGYFNIKFKQLKISEDKQIEFKLSKETRDKYKKILNNKQKRK